MNSPQLFKHSFALAAVIALVGNCHSASAAMITIEPDDYAEGTDLNTIEPGVLLRLYDSLFDVIDPPSITAIESLDDIHPSTGDQVFGRNGIPSFSDTRQLHMTFAAPTDFVSIDFIGASSIFPQIGVLRIYNAAGTVLDTFITPAAEADQVHTMSFTRTSADIKFARAFSAPTELPLGRLDNLKFNKYAVIPEPATICLVGILLAFACGLRHRAV